MKSILHINFSDIDGGAAIAAFRHHSLMRTNGINSNMLVWKKSLNDPNVFAFKRGKLRTLFYKAINKILISYYSFYGAWSWNHFGFDLSKEKIVKDADIIILHWVNFYTISLSSLEKIIKTGKPVFWFMHDMWAITGGCHYSLECSKYTSECHECYLMHNKNGSKKFKDISYGQFYEKLNKLKKYDNLRFITPSNWLANCVRRSAIFKNHAVTTIRNVIYTSLFCCRDLHESRKRLNLPDNKKLILFGADYISNVYKGFNHLADALNCLNDEFECVCYGNSDDRIINSIKLKVHCLGKINNTDKLINLYNACDVMVCASIADNYPNVVMEAMACGLPCVGFNTGGIPEQIDHKINGYITEINNSEELIKGIQWVVENKKSLSDDCRLKAIKSCGEDAVITQWRKELDSLKK